MPAVVCWQLLLLLLYACDGGNAPATPTAAHVAEVRPEVGAPDPTRTNSPLAPTPGGGIIEYTGEELRIYVEVVLALLMNEDATTIYINPYRGEGERLDEPVANVKLPLPLIFDQLRLHDSRTYREAEFADVVGALEDGGKVDDGGVFLTLGPIADSSSEPGVYTVKASIYREVGSAEGNTYRFKRDPSSQRGWTLLDTIKDWSEGS